MTRDEAKKLVMIITASFPNWHPADLKITVNTWAAVLKDYDYKQAETALMVYISTDTSGFAPSIGQVIDKMHVAEDFTELNEMEAWALVSRAIKNGNYGAEEEYAKLPPDIQKAVGDPANLRNWAKADMHSVETVIQSNFMRSFRAVADRKKEYRRLPGQVRELIDQAVGKLEDKKNDTSD